MRRFRVLALTPLSIAAVLIVFCSLAHANGSQFLESYSDPQNPQHIFASFDYASTDGGYYLLHSKDGGKTWKTVPQPDPDREGNITMYGRGYVVGGFFISVGPSDRPRLVITYSDGGDIWRATSELQWQKYTAPDPSGSTENFIPTNHPDRFFAITGGVNADKKKLLWTDTGGTSWQKLSDTLPFGCAMEICRASTSADNRVLVVGLSDTKGYISRDGGKSWSTVPENRLAAERKALESDSKKLWPIKGTPDQVDAAGRAIMAKEIATATAQQKSPDISSVNFIMIMYEKGYDFKLKENIKSCFSSRGARRVRGDVPREIDLADDGTAKAVLEKAANFAQEKCPRSEKEKFADINVDLYQMATLAVSAGTSIGEGSELTWSSLYENRPRDAYLRAEKSRQEEQRRRSEIEARRAKEEAEKNEAKKKFAEFVKKNGVQDWPNMTNLSANPFVYEGKTVAIPSYFTEMLTATDGLFRQQDSYFIVSSIPKGLLTSPAIIIFAGNVIGKKETPVPGVGSQPIPHLKFVGIYICHNRYCADILGK